jgi:transposase InsO family protein
MTEATSIGVDDGFNRAQPPDALLHHSDRGSQYSSEQFQGLMRITA